MKDILIAVAIFCTLNSCEHSTENSVAVWDTICTRPGNFLYNLDFKGDTGLVLGLTSYSDTAHTVFLKTSDGGIHWQEQILEEGFPQYGFETMSPVNSKTIYLSSPIYLYRTDNGGLNWEQITSLYAMNHATRVYFQNRQVGFAFGSNYIYKTINGGYDWENVFHNDTITLNYDCDPFFIDEETCYVIESSNKSNFYLLKTFDGGNHWSEMPIDGRGIRCFVFGDVNHGIVFKGNNQIMTTSNGGTNWKTTHINLDAEPISAAFKSANEGYYASFNKIWKTTDGGNHWILDMEMLNEGPSFVDIQVTRSGEVYAITFSPAAVYKRRTKD